MSKVDDITFEENGNEAWLKYKAAEPLTVEELAEIAGIDLNVWEPVQQEPNAWTMGRKNKKVSMEWIEGKANGHVEDDGTIHKTYMYQMKAKFERIERVAVSPVIKPIIVSSKARFAKAKKTPKTNKTHMLFVTDPHFGFRTRLFMEPETFHSRPFLSDLFAVIKSLKLDYVIWGGDTLDLADFSKFPKNPTIINNTQIAAVEAAWVINQFGMYAPRQKIIEGNHDIRMPKATADNFAAAYQLKPAHELEGPALLSLPRLLGLDVMPGVDWYPGWPDASWEFGDAIFEHGDALSGIPGATVGKVLKDAVKSTIFGHVHRAERATKHVKGMADPIIAATPGGACRKETVPGATLKRNWSIGAFYLTFVDGKLKEPEHISHENGETYFRGERYHGEDYILRMGKEMPEKYMRAL